MSNENKTIYTRAAHMNIDILEGEIINPSGLLPGLLNTPKEFDANLVLFGENDIYLHCITPKGGLLSVHKSEDSNHVYQHILKANK